MITVSQMGRRNDIISVIEDRLNEEYTFKILLEDGHEMQMDMSKDELENFLQDINRLIK